MYVCITFRYAAFSLLFDRMKRTMCGHSPIFISHVSTPLYACTELHTSFVQLHLSCFVELTIAAGG